MSGRKKMSIKDTETLTEGPQQTAAFATEDERDEPLPDKSSGEILSAIPNLKNDLKEDFASKFDTVMQ